METKRIKLKTLIACLAAMILAESGLGAADSVGRYDPLLTLCVARLLEAALLIAIVVLLEKRISVIGFDRAGLLTGMKRGLLWSVGFGAAAVLVFIILNAAGVSPLAYIRAPMPDKALAGYFLVGALISPVTEEIFFRGILYGFFRKWGVVTAVVLSTAIFTLAHSGNGGAGLPQVAGGVVFAVAYEREGSLMVPIIIHVLGNAAIFSLSLFV